MCKSNYPQQMSERGATAAPGPQQVEDHLAASAFRKSDLPARPEEQGQHEEVLAHDESSGIVVFGSFIAGTLVGVIICAPTVVILLFGAGAAALTKSDSKAGKFSRKVGKWSSDVLLGAFRMAREFNQKHRLTDKAKKSAQQATGRVSTEVKKSGIVDSVKARASSLWAHIDERTAPAGQAHSQAEPVAVTDGTKLPFDGTADAYETTSSSSAAWKSLPPKTFDS